MRCARLLLLGALSPVLLACEGDHLVGTPEVAPVPGASASAAFAGARVTNRFPTPRGTLSLIPLEHASFVLGWEGKAIYVDPARPNAYEGAYDEATLPEADAIVITDPHYDHLDPLYVSRLRRPQTVVVGPEAAAARAPMDVVLHNGETRAVLGIKVTAVPAYNLTRGPVAGVRYHDKGRDNGYVLDFGGLRVYVSGDTDCTPEMEALEHIDVAFLGVNVPYAMTPAEASECVAAFHPSVVIPYAYRHADLSTFDRAKMGPGVELRKRNFYLQVDMLRERAYQVFSQSMWGWADDLLDRAKTRNPKGDADWRVQMTRRWTRENQRQWPF